MSIVFDQKHDEFAVYSQRSHLIKYLVVFLCNALLGTASLIICLFFVSGLPFVQPSPFPSLVLFAQIIMAISSILLILCLVWIYSFTIFVIRRLISNQPVLLATQQGIHLRDLPFTGNTFFAWDQVALLSVFPVYQSLGRSIDHLCLYPKDPVLFISRFSLLRRFLVKHSFWRTGTAIHIPQWFFSIPVKEVLLQIQENFQATLQRYEIQISGTHSEKKEA